MVEPATAMVPAFWRVNANSGRKFLVIASIRVSLVPAIVANHPRQPDRILSPCPGMP